MRKLLSVLTAVFVCLSLSACSISASSIRSNLSDAGYTVIEIEAEQLKSLNEELTYNYNGKGVITSGFYGVNNENNESITVLEFEYSDDLTLMYKVAKKSIDSSTQAVDISGNILVFGAKDGVKAALK